jgi:Protein of unknown function (DUF3341)
VRSDIYGLMAEFRSAEEVVAAARQVRAEGYRKVDGYSPYPVEELGEALELHHSPLSKMVLAGGLLGACVGYGLCYWASVIEYPMNVGGRPFHSWPAFVVPTFETTILFAAFTAVLGMLALNGLPEPYHPVFNAPGFALATRDKFFLCIEADDPRFDRARTRAFLAGLHGATDVCEVPH